ncbi:MAG: hypothetical protein RMI94_13825 [Bryobacterales bacterium]|nr:hypothetical protein [Bryobacteraceae bacterium]MDW8131625.1 hypothetical protein [Bryobacterales bacterium]
MTLMAWHPPLWSELLLLVGVATLFLAHWFRRNVLAELKAAPASGRLEQLCQANNLRFLEIRDRLKPRMEPDELAALGRQLNRDYRLLTYLLRHAGAIEGCRLRFIERMLMADFRLVQAWFWLTLRVSERAPLRALQEMISILVRLADSLAARLAPPHAWGASDRAPSAR